MSVSTQYATATASGSGAAVFMFPDVPVGQLWIGTVTVPDAPAAMAGTIDVGGAPVGPIFGPGVYGPYIADSTRRLSISVDGLTPDTQYSAVWHADDNGQRYTTWPGTVTTTVEGTVVIPTPVDVDVVSPNPLPVSVTSPDPLPVSQSRATSAPGGAVTMTGSAVNLPTNPTVQGVILQAPKANAHPISLNGGFNLDPGDITPLIPVDNSDLLIATGTSPDTLTFLVA